METWGESIGSYAGGVGSINHLLISFKLAAAYPLHIAGKTL